MSEHTWTRADLADLHARSEAERDRLMQRIATYEPVGPTCGDSVDRAELALEADLDHLVENRERDRLAQLDVLLQRLDAGTYDVCDACGGPVERPRQEAFPRATTCIACARSAGRRG